MNEREALAISEKIGALLHAQDGRSASVLRGIWKLHEPILTLGSTPSEDMVGCVECTRATRQLVAWPCRTARAVIEGFAPVARDGQC